MTAAVRDHVRPVRWKVRRYLAAAAPLVALTLAAPLAIVLWDDFDIFFTVLSTAPLMAWSSWFAVRDLRAALPVYDRAVAVLMACREVRPAVPPVEVRLLPGPDEHRRLLWDTTTEPRPCSTTPGGRTRSGSNRRPSIVSTSGARSSTR